MAIKKGDEKLLREALDNFRDLSYETGWIAGKMEADESYRTEENRQMQREIIQKRNEMKIAILGLVQTMLEPRWVGLDYVAGLTEK